jgi:hypothetical protein
MADIKTFTTEMFAGIGHIAKKEAGAYIKETVSDAKKFLESMQSDLERWTVKLGQGTLSEKDIASLIRGKKSLLEMKSLTKKGLSQAKIDSIQNQILDLVISKTVDTFLPK